MWAECDRACIIRELCKTCLAIMQQQLRASYMKQTKPQRRGCRGGTWKVGVEKGDPSHKKRDLGSKLCSVRFAEGEAPGGLTPNWLKTIYPTCILLGLYGLAVYLKPIAFLTNRTPWLCPLPGNFPDFFRVKMMCFRAFLALLWVTE